MEPHERLKQSRIAAGHPSGSAAARALGIPEPTYLAHENGSRDFRSDPDAVELYARRFATSTEWLVYGRKPLPKGRPALVPLVGYVGAGAMAHFYGTADNPNEFVDAPEGATDKTVAVEIRGDSMGELFDRWIVYYDDIRSPVTPDLLGKICVVALADDRVLVKRIKQSRTEGLYHLLSANGEPILDVAILWAAKVRHIGQR
ncbi:MAG: LexA family transcriptional regulator [Bauldia sp.]|nr:LexA family transcriptional regulator [Bauldia sp.]